MTKQEAEEIARRYLAPPRFGPLDVVIIPSATVEKEYGWIFHYQRRDYVGGKYKHGLIGNGPLLVEKSGNIVRFPSSSPVEKYIRRYDPGLPFFSHRNRVATPRVARRGLAPQLCPLG